MAPYREGGVRPVAVEGFEKRHEGLTLKTESLVEKYSPTQVNYATGKLGRDPSGNELQLLCGDPEEGVAEDSDAESLFGIVPASAITGALDADEWRQVDKELRNPRI